MTCTRISRRNALKLLAGIPLAVHMRGSDAAGLLRRTIPASGERLPAVGLGTWQVFDVAGQADDLAQARAALSRFVELGASVVDSSPMYGTSESVLGELAAELGVHKRLFLATKVWTSGREAGTRQMEQSIERMRVALKGPLDLMQVHNLVDAKTHLATLRDWKAAGRVRYVGVTHYHEGAYTDLERWLRAGGIDFIQLNYSLAERSADRRLLGRAADSRIAVIVNRPLAGGALFRHVANTPLPAWASEIGCASWAQFFLKWILGHPAVTCAIPGTRNVKHISDNLGAAIGALPDAAMRRKMAAHIDSL
ncbi:MAG: aldo/keto reductase [Betaproteobacteria bacterium RIFCSPLOWO2_12_FULL_63_13]|nr:MAG: aldo/keto reductase [Betaproteobacteria bacterium RIFCSPLOWO2_12_FULL_63_13]